MSTGRSPAPRRARQRRSLVTESRILTAATELFLREGYAATTMAALAAAAGVSVQSLYLRFGGKPDILSAALDVAVVGDAEPVSLLDRPWFGDLQHLDDGRAAVALFVGQVASIMTRTSPLYEVVLRAGDDARDLLASNKRQRYDGVRGVAGVLAAKAGFAEGLSAEAAADRLYALVSEEQFGLLVGERGWSPQEWRSWTTRAGRPRVLPRLTARPRRPSPPRGQRGRRIVASRPTVAMRSSAMRSAASAGELPCSSAVRKTRSAMSKIRSVFVLARSKENPSGGPPG